MSDVDVKTPEQERRNDLLQERLEAAEERYRGRTKKSADAFETACGPLPGGNTRTVIHFDPYPLRIVEAKGAELTDADGTTYVDFLGEYSAGLYGHSEPKIIAAVKAALDKGIVFGGPNLHEIELAGLLCDRFPSLDAVRFTNSGTEANLMAIGAARAHTGRDAVLTMAGGYHGGVLYMAPYAERTNAPYDFIQGTYNDLDATAAAIAGREDALAAILLEPMAGGGGGIPAEKAFLKGLRELADRTGAVLIFDEVMTSRLGRAGLQGEHNIIPDMTTLGKYLGGGLTFGAFGGAPTSWPGSIPARPTRCPMPAPSTTMCCPCRPGWRACATCSRRRPQTTCATPAMPSVTASTRSSPSAAWRRRSWATARSCACISRRVRSASLRTPPPPGSRPAACSTWKCWSAASIWPSAAT